MRRHEHRIGYGRVLRAGNAPRRGGRWTRPAAAPGLSPRPRPRPRRRLRTTAARLGYGVGRPAETWLRGRSERAALRCRRKSADMRDVRARALSHAGALGTLRARLQTRRGSSDAPARRAGRAQSGRGHTAVGRSGPVWGALQVVGRRRGRVRGRGRLGRGGGILEAREVGEARRASGRGGLRLHARLRQRCMGLMP